MNKSSTYKDAGVDIEKAENSLKSLKDRINGTHTPEVLSGVGLFGGFYDISQKGIQHPVLVSSTDGVGTKLKVAMLTGKHDTVGQDLVNHCINDIAVCGAEPLFFLDYFASGSLEPDVYEAVISGITVACRAAGVPLIGGETAEMPDFYQPGDYDMCGTIVGMVDKSKIIDGTRIAAGDLLIGIPSSGLHTNGYTLARKVLLEKYKVNDHVEALGMTLGEALLQIHLNYFPLIRSVSEAVKLNGMAHITGGGIVGNTRRLLADGLDLEINWQAWEQPPIFSLIAETGNVPAESMRQAFNLGIGLVFVVSEEHKGELLDILKDLNSKALQIGRVVAAS